MDCARGQRQQVTLLECDCALYRHDDNGGPVHLWKEGDRLGLTPTLADTVIFFSSLEKQIPIVMVFTAMMPPEPKIYPFSPGIKVLQPPPF